MFFFTAGEAGSGKVGVKWQNAELTWYKLGDGITDDREFDLDIDIVAFPVTERRLTLVVNGYRRQDSISRMEFRYAPAVNWESTVSWPASITFAYYIEDAGFSNAIDHHELYLYRPYLLPENTCNTFFDKADYGPMWADVGDVERIGWALTDDYTRESVCGRKRLAVSQYYPYRKLATTVLPDQHLVGVLNGLVDPSKDPMLRQGFLVSGKVKLGSGKCALLRLSGNDATGKPIYFHVQINPRDHAAGIYGNFHDIELKWTPPNGDTTLAYPNIDDPTTNITTRDWMTSKHNPVMPGIGRDELFSFHIEVIAFPWWERRFKVVLNSDVLATDKSRKEFVFDPPGYNATSFTYLEGDNRIGVDGWRGMVGWPAEIDEAEIYETAGVQPYSHPVIISSLIKQPRHISCVNFHGQHDAEGTGRNAIPWSQQSQCGELVGRFSATDHGLSQHTLFRDLLVNGIVDVSSMDVEKKLQGFILDFELQHGYASYNILRILSADDANSVITLEHVYTAGADLKLKMNWKSNSLNSPKEVTLAGIAYGEKFHLRVEIIAFPAWQRRYRLIVNGDKYGYGDAKRIEAIFEPTASGYNRAFPWSATWQDSVAWPQSVPSGAVPEVYLFETKEFSTIGASPIDVYRVEQNQDGGDSSYGRGSLEYAKCVSHYKPNTNSYLTSPLSPARDTFLGTTCGILEDQYGGRDGNNGALAHSLNSKLLDGTRPHEYQGITLHTSLKRSGIQNILRIGNMTSDAEGETSPSGISIEQKAWNPHIWAWLTGGTVPVSSGPGTPGGAGFGTPGMGGGGGSGGAMDRVAL